MTDLLAHESIDENLRFLILEVGKQIERTRVHFSHPSAKLLNSILARDDYIDNLKTVIQQKVLTFASEVRQDSPGEVHLLNSVDVITINLERIADFCGNVVNQVGYIESDAVLRSLEVDPFFDEVLGGMNHIESALFGRDVQEAIQICRTEAVLDDLYVKVFRQQLEELKSGRETQSHVTLIFISHYFERMGDSLLNIGEAIISACLGEPIKIGQFEALTDSLEAAQLVSDEGQAGEVEMEAILGSRSGHRIARVSARKDSESSRMVIFKEGRAAKLREETESIARWEELSAGIAPKVYSVHERGDMGAVLFEYLPGKTFEDVLLTGTQRELDTVLSRITDTVRGVWEQTKVNEPVRPEFMKQLTKRLPDIYTVHPEFRNGGGAIGAIKLLSLDELIHEAAAFDELLSAPFSVFIHGDFNVDNIIYDAIQDRIRFIDLHRSREMDYVQDVSVFLVSSFRLQVFKAQVRRRINRSIMAFHRFAREYAESVSDETFSLRLALGLARSFATSTRFVLDPSFSRTMILKARYLLERVLTSDRGELSAFTLPGEALLD